MKRIRVLPFAVLLELTVMSFGRAVETTAIQQLTSTYSKYPLTCCVVAGWNREGYKTSRKHTYAQLLAAPLRTMRLLPTDRVLNANSSVEVMFNLQQQPVTNMSATSYLLTSFLACTMACDP